MEISWRVPAVLTVARAMSLPTTGVGGPAVATAAVILAGGGGMIIGGGCGAPPAVSTREGRWSGS